MKILGIILAYNEFNTIKNVVTGIQEGFPQSDILVIDGGSTDNTLEILSELGINFVVLPSYFGIGGAEETGLKYAYQKNYDIVFRVDGDDQHKYSEIGNLLKPLIENRCDFVLGSRYLIDTGYVPSFLRKIGNVVFSNLIRLVTGLRITDPTSSFHAFNSRIINYFETYHDFDYSEVESIVIMKKAGFRILEISTAMKQREAGNSSFSFMNAFEFVFSGVVSILVNSIRKIPLGDR
jgi:glycosyltransferase involved in cell wall biosynthesis